MFVILPGCYMLFLLYRYGAYCMYLAANTADYSVVLVRLLYAQYRYTLKNTGTHTVHLFANRYWYWY